MQLIYSKFTNGLVRTPQSVFQVRDTLVELAKWMEKAESIENKQSVSVITVMQQYFSEKSPTEWLEIKKRLVAAGVMSE